jgi:hypothetical protein
MASKVVALASLGVMLGIIGIFIITRTQQKYLLLLQSGYFAVFFAAILFTAYSGF